MTPDKTIFRTSLHSLTALLLAVALFAVGLASAGCGDTDESKKFSEKMGEVYDAAVEAFQAEKDQLMDKVGEQMDKAEAYLDALNAAARESGDEAVIKLREQMESLQAEMKKAKEAGKETWDATKEDLSEALAALQERMEELKQKLKEE